MSERGHGNPPSRVRETVPPNRDEEAQQPRWRRDFPIDWARDDFVSRRDLVKFMVLTSAAFAIGQSWLVIKSKLRGAKRVLPALPIAGVDELAPGTAKTFVYPEGSTPRLLVKLGAREFVAYDQQCTHLQCPVVPAVADGKLHCPCHNGSFDLRSGQPLAGPPRRRLPRVRLELRGDTVFAIGIEDSEG